MTQNFQLSFQGCKKSQISLRTKKMTKNKAIYVNYYYFFFLRERE